MHFYVEIDGGLDELVDLEVAVGIEFDLGQKNYIFIFFLTVNFDLNF